MARAPRTLLLRLLLAALALSALLPAGAAARGWHSVRLPGLDESVLYGMSCPSPTLCVGVGTAADPPEGHGSAGLIVSSRNPAGPAGAWRAVKLHGRGGYVPNPRDISCPSPRFCAMVANKGRIYTTNHPQHGIHDWDVVRVPGVGSLRKVSCISSRLCVVGANYGRLVASSDPLGGPGAWRVSQAMVSEFQELSTPHGLACTGPARCFVADSLSILTSGDPYPGEWSPSHLLEPPEPSLAALACPSASLCVAASGGGFLVSSQPADPAGAWTAGATHDPGDGIMALACASTSSCVASTELGNLLVAEGPAFSHWRRDRRFPDRDASIRALACPSPALCVGGGRNGFVVSSAEPFG